MKQHVQVELDVVFEGTEDPEVAGETPDEAAEALAMSVPGSVTFALVSPFGSGGGWPVYRFTGELGSIAELVYEYNDGDLGDTLEVLKSLKPATPASV